MAADVTLIHHTTAMQEELFLDEAGRLDDLRRAIARCTRWARHSIAPVLATLHATD